MMKILITGGAGFVGSHLAEYYLSDGHDVTILDNLSRTNFNLECLREHFPVKVVKGNIEDFDTVKRAVKDKDLICHTAGQVAVTTSVADPVMDFKINALGTLNVLEAIRQTDSDPALIFTSTNKVYGAMKGVEIIQKDTRYDYKDLKNGVSELQPLDFYSPYGCSKGCADQYVRDYHRIYDLKTVVFRMSCIYGTRQFGNEDQGWVAHFVISSVLGNPLTIYGDGKQIRDILFIDDLVRAFTLSMNKINRTKGEIYNIGGGKENTISLLELIEYLENLLGRKIGYSLGDWRPGDQKVYYSDIRKAEKDFDWRPAIAKEEGIKKLFDWIVENEQLFK